MNILFVAVNYNTAQHALKFVECFPKERIDSGELSVIMVDNTDGETRYALKESVNERFPNVTCLLPPRNLGYFGGAQYGLDYASSVFDAPDWVVVSNVDITLSVDNALKILAELDNGRTGIVAPAIISRQTGRSLNPFFKSRPSAIRMHAYRYLFNFYWSYVAYVKLFEWKSGLRSILHNSRGGSDRRVEPYEVPGSIYAPHGACVFISREFFERGGSLHHELFLYGEEILLAEQARKLDLRVLYDPRITVMHEHQVSTGKLPGKTRHHFVREAARYSANNYFRRPC